MVEAAVKKKKGGDIIRRDIGSTFGRRVHTLRRR